MFVEKTADELEKMTADELQSYLVEKMEADRDALSKKMEALENAKEEDIAALKEELKEMTSKFEETTEKVIKATAEQGKVLAKLVQNNTSDKVEKSELLQFIEKNAEDLNGRVKNGKIQGENLGFKSVTVKAAALMTTANVITNVANGFNQLFGNYIDPEIGHTPKAGTFILPLVDTQQAPGTENIWWVDRVNEEGDAEFIGEGDLKPLIDGEYQEFKTDVKEVAERWKMSNRLINHAPSVVTDFRQHADELIENKIDDGVLYGDGTGNNLSGLATEAAPFVVPTGLANYYPAGNIFDAIMAVATYVRLNNFKGQLTCVLNTVWMAKMKGIKDADNNYIVPPFVAPDGTQVGEVRIVFHNRVNEDKILLGDMKKFKVRISENVQYFEGWENDDFSKNLSSRKLEAFLGTYMHGADAGSIIYDDISTVLTAITV